MKKRRIVVLTAFAMGARLSGCSLFSGEDPHAPAELQDFKPAVVASVQWKTNVGTAASKTLVAAVTPAGVFRRGGDSIYRLDHETGKVEWQKQAASPITAGVGADAEFVAIGTEKGEVEVYDVEGNFLWRATLTSSVQIPPLVGNGMVVVKTSDTRITAYNARNGQRLWYYQGQVPALTVHNFTAMSWSPAGILVPQANGRLLALSPKGQSVFEVPIGQAKGITEVERLIDVVGRPWVDRELMCAAAFQGNLTCMQTQNARTVWSAPLDAASGVFSDQQLVYAVDSVSKIHAFNRRMGRQAWVNDEMLYRSLSAPVRIGGVLAVGDYDGVITMLNPADGTVVARTRLSGAITSPATPMNYGAVFQTVEGDVAFVLQEPLLRD